MGKEVEKPEARQDLMVVSYKDDVGQLVVISREDVKQYLAPGQQITDQELVMFLQLCKYRKLNPFLKEAYIVKYGSHPAAIITSKDVFLRRAENPPKFMGMKSGIVVNDNMEREGTIMLDKESHSASDARSTNCAPFRGHRPGPVSTESDEHPAAHRRRLP